MKIMKCISIFRKTVCIYINVIIEYIHLLWEMFIFDSRSLQTLATVELELAGENLLFRRIGLLDRNTLLGTDLGVPCGEESLELLLISLMANEGDLELSSSLRR